MRASPVGTVKQEVARAPGQAPNQSQLGDGQDRDVEEQERLPQKSMPGACHRTCGGEQLGAVGDAGVLERALVVPCEVREVHVSELSRVDVREPELAQATRKGSREAGAVSDSGESSERPRRRRRVNDARRDRGKREGAHRNATSPCQGHSRERPRELREGESVPAEVAAEGASHGAGQLRGCFDRAADDDDSGGASTALEPARGVPEADRRRRRRDETEQRWCAYLPNRSRREVSMSLPNGGTMTPVALIRLW